MNKKIKKLKYISLILSITIFGIMLVSPVFVVAADPEPEKATINAAEDISVILQIPLPFVETNCEKVDSDGVTHEAVCDLSTYIRGVYRLLIGAGALFAVVMMIIAGYQWILSGGSSEKTGSAKKRIFNAWIGLVLALLSYVILNAITPRLVSLWLPVVEPVQRFDLTSDVYCNDPNNKPIQDLCDQNASCLALKTADFPRFIYPIESAECGKDYYVSGEVGATDLTSSNLHGECSGGFCSGNSTCISGQCYDAVIFGNINWPAFSNTYVDSITLHAVCTNSSKVEKLIQTKSIPKLRAYRIPRKRTIVQDDAWNACVQSRGISSGQLACSNLTYEEQDYKEVGIKACGSFDKFKGFVLEVEVNDDKGGWFNILPTDDDTFALGKVPNTRNCLANPFKKDTPTGPRVDFDKIDFKLINDEKLFTIDDIERSIECNITITDGTWPLDDGS